MTSPGNRDWPATDPAYRRSEVTAALGAGDAVWARAGADVLGWRVKTASGFSVDSRGPACPGERVRVTARCFGLGVVEPIEVVAVVRERDRVGFSYRTLPGHPVSGEEAFIVHRHGGQAYLTVRSITRAAPQQPWRALFPLLRVVQHIVRRRYLRALL
ncbi:DUF1990 family protein [Arthrobacter halodurans]|uniref:DUF1990 family protein n=1 Tax=Arthrobacter halodurans TaxID=516699 RepID=A0ABV4UKS2_9MICC